MNQNSFSQNENNGTKAPWYLQPDIKPPRDYNPYDEQSSSEPEDKPQEIKRLPWETPDLFEYRRTCEEYNAKKRAKDRLRKIINEAFFPVLLTLLMMNAFSSAFVMLDGFIPAKVYQIIYNIHLVFSYVALFPVTFFIYSVGKKCKTYTFFKRPDASKFYVLRWTVMIFGVTHAVATLFHYLFVLLQKIGLRLNDLPSVPHDSPFETVMYFITVVICAPIFEELLFRGFLLTRLRRFGSWFAIITTGIMFGLFHQNHQQLFFATAFGILTAFVASRTRSIIPGIIAHICLNGYAFILELLTSFAVITGDTVLDPSFKIEAPLPLAAAISVLDILSYVLMIVGLVMLVTEIATNRNQFSFSDEKKVTKGEGFKLIFSSPIAIILILILVSNLILVSFVDLDYFAALLESAGGYY